MLIQFLFAFLVLSEAHADRILTDFAVCAKMTGTEECARKVESEALKGQSVVTRDKKTLSIKTAKKTIKYDDGSNDSYAYLKTFAKESMILVRKQLSEGSNYQLIDAATGDVTVIDDIPVFSPSGSRFVTGSRDLMAGFNPNRIQLWEKADGVWKKRFSFGNDEWGAGAARWKSDREVQFDRYVYDDKAANLESISGKPVVLSVAADGNWRLQP